MRSGTKLLVVGALSSTLGCISGPTLGDLEAGSSSDGETAYSPGSSPGVETETDGRTSVGSQSDGTGTGDGDGSSSGDSSAPGSSSGDSLCGDGVEDPGEQCDDGNDQNADGCNVDCVVSGARLWSQDHIVSTADIAVGPGDVIHAAAPAQGELGVALFRFAPGGELLGETRRPPPLTPSPNGGGSVLVNGLAAGADGSTIVSVTFEDMFDDGAGGVVSGVERTLRTGAGGWVHDAILETNEFGTHMGFRFDLLDDGTLIGLRDHTADGSVFQRLTAAGELDLERPSVAGYQVYRGVGDTLVVALEGGFDVLDTEGTVLWSAVVPGYLRTARATPNGELLAVVAKLEDSEEKLMLGRWSAQGVELQTLTWPQAAEEAVVESAAIDDEGNAVVGVRGSILKFSPDFELLWEREGTAWRLVTDSTGAILAAHTSTIDKYAP